MTDPRYPLEICNTGDDTYIVMSKVVQRARELENERAMATAAVAAAEQDLAQCSRIDLTDADKKWRELTAGVLDLDEDARHQARRLVSDTFQSITVWLKGVRPDETPAGSIDVMLTAKGGASRMLRVTLDGSWVAGQEVVEAP